MLSLWRREGRPRSSVPCRPRWFNYASLVNYSWWARPTFARFGDSPVVSWRFIFAERRGEEVVPLIFHLNRITRTTHAHPPLVDVKPCSMLSSMIQFQLALFIDWERSSSFNDRLKELSFYLRLLFCCSQHEGERSGKLSGNGKRVAISGLARLGQLDQRFKKLRGRRWALQVGRRVHANFWSIKRLNAKVLFAEERCVP